MPFVEVAVWHKTLTALEIESAVGMPARIAHSVGEVRNPDTGVHFESYCRFDLGSHDRVKAKSDVPSLERFRPLLCSPAFAQPGSLCLAYFTMTQDASELYLGDAMVAYLAELGMGAVLRR